MGEVMIQYRVFDDETYSVMARVYNPEKKFYEHPEYINLSIEDCMERMNEVMDNQPSVEEIENTWVYIGD